MLLRALRYSFAVVAALVAVGLTALVSRAFALGHGYTLLPLASVMIVSLIAGRGPALLTAALCGLGVAYFAVHPYGLLAISERSGEVVLVLYGAVAVAVAHLGASVRGSLLRAQLAREAADRALTQLRDLQSVTEAALEDRPLAELLRELLSRSARIFGADVASLLLLDEGREALEIAAAVGMDEAWWRGVRVPLGTGLAGRVFVGRRPMRVEDVAAIEDMHQTMRREVRSALGVPLLVEGRALGVLNLGARSERRFTDEDVALLELTASRIARAVERSQLRDAAALRAAQQAAIAALGQQAIAGEPIPRLLEEAVATLVAELRAEFASALELLPDGRAFIPRALIGWSPDPDLLISAGPETQPGYALRSQGPVVVEDYRAEARFPISCVLREAGVISAMSVIIPGDAQPFGVLNAFVRRKRLFTEDDVHFLEAIANVISAAVRNHQAIAAARQAEQHMERLYHEALEAVRAREEFLSIASHELRTPLTPLELQLASVQRALRADPARISPAKLLEKVNVAARQVERLQHLVSDLLDLSMLTAGDLVIHREAVDLAAAARDAAQRSREALARAGCELHLSIDGPVQGWWDWARIDQVLSNLLSNAIKYGAGRPIDLVIEGDDSAARIIVRDRGIGIAADQQARIFGRFERGVSDRHYGGFGLGLWIVKQILDALGGTIAVESAPGKGSTFTVTLPRRARESAEAA